ncbi:hypothetical protein BJY04DRAFT_219744 [Aspergillus karnatakaensis]|uniref:uncharacterized protein n=1 Tax=Aspergillus karnatakaensis TaxID=1810916 RepID=UPI003CCDC9F4
MSTAVAVRIENGPAINEIVLLSDDMSLEAVQEAIYLAFKPQIPQIWFDEFGGDMGKMADIWVEWTSTNERFPQVTNLTETNVAAVLKLLELRRGVDVLSANLPNPPQPEEETYEEQAYEEPEPVELPFGRG